MVRSQADRDEQTIAIGTALGIFVIIMGAALLVLWLLSLFTDVADGRTDTFFPVTLVLAGTVAREAGEIVTVMPEGV